MKGCFLSLSLLVPALLGLAHPAGAQSLNVTTLVGQSPSALVQKLMGLGISSYSNVSYAGTAWSAGTFTGGNGIIGFDSGIILSNGSAASVAGSSGSGTSTCNYLPGDSDLATLTSGPTTDATLLSFDFVPIYNNITFQYVFGSSEYNQYVGSQYNDVMGFFVNGTNRALLPGTSTAININNINACTNPAYFINNTSQSTTYCAMTLPSANLNTALTGLTTVLTVNVAVTPGVTNHIKLGISDVGDCNLDSDVFIQASSFSSGPTATPTATFTSTWTATWTDSFTPTLTPTITPTSTPTSTPTLTPTPTPTDTPCGYPGNTCTPTLTPTPTSTPPYVDVFEVTKNIFNPSEPVSILVEYTTYPGPLELRVYNSTGEYIKTLDSEQLSQPVSQWFGWDGKNRYGDPCASGVYIIYLVETRSIKTKRIILVK